MLFLKDDCLASNRAPGNSTTDPEKGALWRGDSEFQGRSCHFAPELGEVHGTCDAERLHDLINKPILCFPRDRREGGTEPEPGLRLLEPLEPRVKRQQLAKIFGCVLAFQRVRTDGTPAPNGPSCPLDA